jgi:hypothetical protein
VIVGQIIAFGLFLLVGLGSIAGFLWLVTRPVIGRPRLRVPDDEAGIQRLAGVMRERFKADNETTMHGDQMLTWAIGLMGAGLFGSKDFLTQAPSTLRFVPLLPWTFGILCAVAARLLGSELSHQATVAFSGFVEELETLLFLDRAGMRAGLPDAIARHELNMTRLARWMRNTNDCFYGAHIFLGLGIAAVLVVAYCTLK